MCVDLVKESSTRKMMDCQKQSAPVLKEDSPLRISCTATTVSAAQLNGFYPKVSAMDVVPDPTTSSGSNEGPMDLSQLSTRRADTKRIQARSASESCLAERHCKKMRLEDKVHQLKHSEGDQSYWFNLSSGHHADPLRDSLRFRSMSEMDLSSCRTSWLATDLEAIHEESEASPSVAVSGERHTKSPSPSGNDDLLRYRCLSDSRLSTATNLLPILDRVHSKADISGDKLEFLLRRTASESVIPSSRSPEAAAAAIEVLKRQQEWIEQHCQQLLQNGNIVAGPGSSTDPSSYLAAPWLYLGLFGYSHMLQSFQAQEYLRQMTAAQHQNPDAEQVSAGPSSPVPSPSCSDEGDSGGHSGMNPNKRRSPRALTGKHVRLGTGASPTTLHTLRLKIEERQRLKLKGLPANWNSTSVSVGRSNGTKKNGGKVKSRAK